MSVGSEHSPVRGVGSMLRYSIPLVVFLILAGFLAYGLRLKPGEVPSPLIDKAAPGFSLPSLDDPGRTVTRQQMLGKVWILNFWASWCATCSDEHPVLLELSRRNLVPIYGVNYKDKREDALRWLEQNGNPFQQAISDTAGGTGIDYGVYALPETFLIDKAGVIRFKQIGAVTPEVVEKRILPLIRELNG